MASGQRVAVVGATGAVGQTTLKLLEERDFPVRALRVLASARSVGKTLDFKGEKVKVEQLTANSFSGIDLALFSAGTEQSREFAPHAVRAGAIVIDKSNAFRMDPNVPLVVPEVNADDIAKNEGIIANPNCSTIIAITPLWPVHRTNRIRRMIVATYQAASGGGAAAMEELRESTRACLEGRTYENRVLPHPYAFNLFSHNSKVDPQSGYN
ncbi:MAG: aspartate-semialdehyde dehydrogenase, partial [Pseudomonadota bacterium]